MIVLVAYYIFSYLVSIQFKTLRPPHISYSTPPLNVAKTTILTCKFLLSQNTTIPIDKLKLLYKGKVLGDVTFLREVFGDQGVEGGAGVLNVMLMGGAVPKAGSGAGAGVAQLVETGQGEMDVDKEGTPVVQAENKEADPGMEMDVDRKVGVLGTEEFWEELKAWLGSKLEGGEAAPEEVVHVFREAWKGVKGGQ